MMTCRRFSFPLVLVLAAATAFAQAAQQPKPQPKEKEKPKKVWTNEDVEALRGRSGVSVLGGASSAAAASYAEAAPVQPGATDPKKDPQWYRQKLGPLRNQIDQIDARIKSLEDMLANPSTGAGLNLNSRGVSLSPQNELEQLRKQRAKVQQQIDDIEDEARRNGIEPGALR